MVYSSSILEEVEKKVNQRYFGYDILMRNQSRSYTIGIVLSVRGIDDRAECLHLAMEEVYHTLHTTHLSLHTSQLHD